MKLKKKKKKKRRKVDDQILKGQIKYQDMLT
jgi:hypothetical protein